MNRGSKPDYGGTQKLDFFAGGWGWRQEAKPVDEASTVRTASTRMNRYFAALRSVQSVQALATSLLGVFSEVLTALPDHTAPPRSFLLGRAALGAASAGCDD